MYLSRNNNFDIIRLVAAMQVAVSHTFNHLHVPTQINFMGGGEGMSIKFPFPGVIVFFVISGFLVTASLERNKNIKHYIINRVLRIVPALYIAFILTLIALNYFDYINSDSLNNLSFWGWAIGQLTLFQFYTPDFLRSYGVGCPNGSLWTIPVEFVFYLLLPIIVTVLKNRRNLGIILIAALSVVANYFLSKYGDDSIISKLVGVSVIPYLYIFLIGSLLYYNWERLSRFFEGKAYIFLIIYILWTNCIAGPAYEISSAAVLIANILLCLLVISMAYTLPKIGKILHGFDLSYGLYVYHMIVVNVFVQLGLYGNSKYAVISLCISIALGCLSWQFVERNALKLKNKI